MKTSISCLLFIPLFSYISFLPKAQAVSPPPDGAYSNFTTAEGQNALQDLTTGVGNTALGAYSLFSTTTGSYNTAVGAGALDLNTGDSNTAVGVAALLLNTGTGNTATGTAALELNDSGSGNTATGSQALFSNTSGNANTAIGVQALASNDTGSGNTAVGAGTLLGNTGSDNIALGDAAGLFLTTGDHNIDIGNNGVPGDSDTTRIGNNQGAIYLAGIAGQTVGAGGTTCYVDNDGKLGVLLSSRRFKTNIADMGTASAALLALRPVIFRYKREFDKTGTPQFGLVAEEVAKVNPNLVTRDAKGELSTVRYEAVNAMLLNEFLKEHQTVQKLKTQVAELAAGLQKLSAELEVNKSAPQIVRDDH